MGPEERSGHVSRFFADSVSIDSGSVGTERRLRF
jgi:hypothetical protein